MAIEQGLTILSWFENLPKDETPPEYLWEDTEGLEAWWKSVEAKREDGMSTISGRDYDADDDDEEPAARNGKPAVMVQNDLATFVKG